MAALISRVRIAAVVASLVIAPGAAQAEVGRDTYIQESGQVRIEIDSRGLEEFARMFELGYPPATVMLHAISAGMSINDILYLAVKSDLSRAREFYDTAESLLPALPGWVCQAEADRGRYTREVDLTGLGDAPTLRRIADLFFDDDRRVVPFPDWTAGKIHMEASTVELVTLVSDQRWYVPGEDDGSPLTEPNRPVFVSLYPHSGQIVVDGGMDRIRHAREQGMDRLPVVLVYNDMLQRPISSFENGATVGELADRFFGEGVELTAVPEWQVGDHHKKVSLDELQKLVDIPRRDAIPAERWAAVEREIRGNDMKLPRPLLLTLVKSGRGKVWIDDPTTAAVASHLGIEGLPVVLFYHRLDRRPCGQPSNCEDLLCEAATAAGASDAVCRPGGGSTAASGYSRSRLKSENSSTLGMDLRLYEGLSYTQNYCSAS